MRYLILSLWLLFAVHVSAQSNDKDTVYTYVEQMPEPGDSLNVYLYKNIHYPDSARDNGIEGKVFLKFIVNEDGSISDCKVLKGIRGGCNEEALRVAKNMPAWKPGRKDGKPVRTFVSYPVVFKLEWDTATAYTVAMVDKPPMADYDVERYLKLHVHYPDAAMLRMEAGYVRVKFVINKDGRIGDCEVVKEKDPNLGKYCDKEALMVVENMPNWSPGEKNGKPVKVGYSVLVPFKFDSTEENMKLRDSVIKSGLYQKEVYTYVEHMPVPTFNFPEYLAKNIHYPKYALEHNITGRVIVKFVVNEDGSISNCQAIRGIDSSCDKEAVRVIKEMPRWKPGVQNGKPVKVYFTQPITFNIEGGTNAGKRARNVSKYGKVSRGDYDSFTPVPIFDVQEYFDENLQYPDSAIQLGIKGDVLVGFTVNEDGSISNIKLALGIGGGCDQEAIRLIKNMPKWQPALLKGNAIKQMTFLSVTFDKKKLNKSKATKKSSQTKPAFPGFDFKDYFNSNLQYPDTAIKAGVKGQVIVEFVINEDGYISHAHIVKGIGGGCDEEALRLIESMPAWSPAEQNGNKVKSKYTLPVIFEPKKNN